MSITDIFTILISLAAIFSYINYRFIKVPSTIGLLVIALFMSLAIILLGKMGLPIEAQAKHLLSQIDFNETLMQGMLSALLFAGALHVHLDELNKQKWVVAVLASVGVISSTFMIGFASFYIFGWMGLDIPLIYCLLFGSLISPTDPIAVLGILKTVGASKSLETKIAGESLFNDGVAIVVFLVLLSMAGVGGHGGHEEVNAMSIATLFAQEALGGAIFGLVIGYIAFRMLASIDNYQVEILLTLALVFGGMPLPVLGIYQAPSRL